MSTTAEDPTIAALLVKRAALAIQIQEAQSAIFHLDATLRLLGHDPHARKAYGRLFANGELIALIGEAERAGHKTPVPILDYLMKAKGLDATDKRLRHKLLYRVKDCRRRMNARGV
jgi:hypothetical protein